MAGFAARVFLCAALAGLPLCRAYAEGPALCGGTQTRARIAEAIDGASLRLADGRVVRLASVIAPLPIDGDSQAVARSRAELGEMANGQDAVVFLSAETKDRYGRLTANAVLIEEKFWLEAAMLERGTVRFFSAANDRCAKELLQSERKARAAQAGLWKESHFRMFEAGEIEPLLAAAGRFVVVEGTIQRVGEARGRTYLDFGRRFTEDFTIIMPDSLRKNLTEAGSNPKSWRGRRVRVRGILFSWGGPAIEINLAQAIELLDHDIPKSE